ncbi:GGPPS synthase, partial [Acromyrmex insinuator]
MKFLFLDRFDDIQDEAIMRCGFPVTHSVYGLHYSINAANYLQFLACEKLINLHPMAIKIVIEQFMEYYRGQGMDLYWKEKFICPKEEDYNILAMRKSAWLIIMVVKLMKLFSTYEEDIMLKFLTIIQDILKQRSKNIEVKRYCVKILESYGSFKYTKDVLDELEKKIRTEIDRLGGNPLLVQLLDDYRNKMLKTRI